MSSSPSATGGPPPKSNLLRIDQLHVGGFYDFQFVADDELSPDAPEHLREEYKYVYGTSRLGLVVAVMPSYVRVLVYTLCPPGGVAANGDQHRWIPFSPTNRFAHQPEIHVETAPSELAVPESDKLYLCFTHVVQISKCRGGSAADETGGETAGATDEHFQTCTNLGAIRQAHADYWAGARYDENGAKYGGCQAGPSNQVKTWYDEPEVHIVANFDDIEWGGIGHRGLHAAPTNQAEESALSGNEPDSNHATAVAVRRRHSFNV